MKYIISIIALMLHLTGFSQNDLKAAQQSLYEQVVALDHSVFDAFNNCDIEKFKTYFTDDVEFYHDKGGVTLSINKLAESVEKGVCGNPGIKVRRAAITETLQVYPMDNYGAIITGEHLFYQTTNGVEKLTGKAKFTHLCRLEGTTWKIHRVLSYDHQAM